MRAGSQRTILLFALFLMACAAVLFCVSFENTPLEPYRVTSTGQSEAASSAPAASPLSEEKVNINTASKEELIGLNGIGEVLADRIIEYREANGGYKDGDRKTVSSLLRFVFTHAPKGLPLPNRRNIGKIEPL